MSNSDKACDDLLESVVQGLIDGLHRKDISADLVRQQWPPEAATRFVELASTIHHELKFLPEHRAALAKRGHEGMQAAYGWIGAGIGGWALMYLFDGMPRKMALYALILPLYGIVELISGFLLWWPHRDFLQRQSNVLSTRPDSKR